MDRDGQQERPAAKRAKRADKRSESTTAWKEDNCDEVRNLIKWALDNGCRMDGLKIVKHEMDGHRGIVRTSQTAGKAAKTAATSITVPQNLIFTYEQALKTEAGKLVSEVISKDSVRRKLEALTAVPSLAKRLVMYAALIEQRAVPSSAWHVYAKALPLSYSMPIWYTAEQQQLIAGTNVAATAVAMVTQLQQAHALVWASLSQSQPEAFPQARFSLQNMVWAHGAVTSRGFPTSLASHKQVVFEPRSTDQQRLPQVLDDPGCMLPILDMLNHHPDSDVLWRTTQDGRLIFETQSSVLEGAEFFNCYGRKSNEELLLDYGFCIEDNPFDDVSVGVGVQAGELSDRQLSAARMLLNLTGTSRTVRSYLETGIRLSYNGSERSLRRAVITVAVLLQDSQAEMDDCIDGPDRDSDASAAARSGDVLTSVLEDNWAGLDLVHVVEIHPTAQQAVLALQGLVDGKQRKLPGTDAEDETLITENNPYSPEWCIGVYRRSQRRLLGQMHAALAALLSSEVS